MPTQCRPVSFGFQGCQGRKVMAAFDGGSITSNGGALLLRGTDRSIGLFDRVAACFTDRRDPRLTEHSVRTLVAQRITGIALGYEDLNDHDFLRHDPLLALLSGKLEGGRKGCAALAGKSTLNRLEHAPGDGRPERYHRIAHDPEALQALLTELFIESWPGRLPPSRLVLDIDATDDKVHGRQEGRSFHGYYGHHCLLPLYIFCGKTRCAPCSGRATPAFGRDRSARPHRRPAAPPVARARHPGAGRLRTPARNCWPGARTTVDYVIGVARNARLARRIAPELLAARVESQGRRRPVRTYEEFAHSTRRSWSRSRRVIAKAEHLPGKANPRFVVTSLPETVSPRTVYERVYCPRGNAEQRHQGAAARSVRATGPPPPRLPRQPAPSPLLRLRLHPHGRAAPRALRHRPGPRHRRHAAPEAPQNRSARDGLGAQGQGRHGLRASLRLRLRPRPRPITRIETATPGP